MSKRDYRWLTRQHVRTTMLLAHPRCTTYFVVAAVMLFAISFYLFWMDHPLTIIVALTAPLLVLFAFINEGRQASGHRAVATTEWLAALVEIMGHHDAKLILERAAKNASSGHVLTRRNVLEAMNQIRADQRRYADEARGLKSDDINSFLSDQAQRRAKP